MKMTIEEIAAETIEQAQAHGNDSGRMRLQRLICEQLSYPRDDAIAIAQQLLSHPATRQGLTEALKQL